MRSLLPLCLAALLIAAGCSKDKDVEPPAVLTNFPNSLPVKKLWGDNVGGGKKQVKLRLGLGPALDGGVVYAASDKGEVLAVNLETGKSVWIKKLKMPLSAGPTAGFGMVVVGSSKGVLVALDETSGKERGVPGSIPSCCRRPRSARKSWCCAPSTAVCTGSTRHTGKELWQVEQQVPRLSLRGTATPVIAKDLAIWGFDNGKVMAVSLVTGDTVWDTALASPARPHRARPAGRRRFRGPGGRR